MSFLGVSIGLIRVLETLTLYPTYLWWWLGDGLWLFYHVFPTLYWISYNDSQASHVWPFADTYRHPDHSSDVAVGSFWFWFLPLKMEGPWMSLAISSPKSSVPKCQSPKVQAEPRRRRPWHRNPNRKAGDGLSCPMERSPVIATGLGSCFAVRICRFTESTQKLNFRHL